MNQPAPSLLFLTTIEVAGVLRISRRTLERMRVEGTGPRYIKVGPGKRSRVLYRQQEVEVWPHSPDSDRRFLGSVCG